MKSVQPSGWTQSPRPREINSIEATVSDTLHVGVKRLDNGWHSFVPIGPTVQISLGPTIAATLRFVDGSSVELELRTVDGQIPEWYDQPVPHHRFKYVGMSNTHRATFFEVRP